MRKDNCYGKSELKLVLNNQIKKCQAMATANFLQLNWTH